MSNVAEQKIFVGNNIELLKKYPDNFFDSIVTDPPYGLGKEPNAEEMLQAWITTGYLEVKGTGFMGKEWDAFIPQPIFWKEVFRVLKHGGHVVSFFGTRTYDWGVMSMRLAGFEIRDCIQWLYGSGFPKSHNISKAIDKMGGQSLDWFIDYILKVSEERGITKKELSMLFPSKNGKSTGWLWNKQNNQSITLEQYNKIKDFLKLPFDNIAQAEREVIGKGKAGLTKGEIANFSGETEFDITAPSTDQAKEWDGWGSALKPANEPIVLARKPLEKGLSIAENVLKWGTGAINIDASRIGTTDSMTSGRHIQKNREYPSGYTDVNRTEYEQNVNGRFPSNVILTHHPECECLGLKKFKPSNGSGRASEKGGGFNKGMFGNGTSDNIGGTFIDENGEETIENWNCHDDCPIKILDEQSGELKSGNLSGKEYIEGHTGKEVYGKFNGFEFNSRKGDTGGASRFFYVAKASKSERNFGLNEELGKRKTPMAGRGQGGLKCKKCNKWKNSGSPCKCQNPEFEEIKFESKANFNGHPTVKPVKLMQYLVRMITPPNGTVLDPFSGSGTTGVACKIDGFNFVGLELSEEYAKIAQARIDVFVEEKELIDNCKIFESEKNKIESQYNLFD